MRRPQASQLQRPRRPPAPRSPPPPALPSAARAPGDLAPRPWGPVGACTPAPLAQGLRERKPRPSLLRAAPAGAPPLPAEDRRQRKPRPRRAGRHFRGRFCISAVAAPPRAVSFVRRTGHPFSQRGSPRPAGRHRGRGGLGERRRARVAAGRGWLPEAAPLPSQPPPSAPTAISNRRPRSCSACSAPGRAPRGRGGALAAAAAALSRARPPPGSGLAQAAAQPCPLSFRRPAPTPAPGGGRGPAPRFPSPPRRTRGLERSAARVAAGDGDKMEGVGRS